MPVSVQVLDLQHRSWQPASSLTLMNIYTKYNRGRLLSKGISRFKNLSISDLSIVRPLVRHVEGGLDGAAVGVVAAAEEVLIELLVQVVDGVIEGEEDELRDLVGRVAAGDVAAAAVAVLRRLVYQNTAHTGIINEIE